jgi:hypothetical protein
MSRNVDALRTLATTSNLLSSLAAPPFHLTPLHSRPDLHLLTPSPLTPIQRPLLPPHHVVVLANPLLRKDTSTQRPSRHLDENLELNGQAAIDRVDALEDDVRKHGDGREAEGAGEEATRCFFGDLVWGRDRGRSGGRMGCGCRRGHCDCSLRRMS